MAPTYKKKVELAPLTEEELDAVTIVFHQFETGLREGTIYTLVSMFCSQTEIEMYFSNLNKIYIRIFPSSEPFPLSHCNF